MCFLIFNKKIELGNLSDIMSTFINKNVKLETTITVPENYVGLIYFRDKYVITLPAGNHKLQGDTFFELFNRNKRKNKDSNSPRYDFNIHYVNISRQNFEISFKHLSSFKQKIDYKLTALYEINNPRTFATELLTTWYKTTNDRTLKYIKSWFTDFCYYAMEKKFDNDKSFHYQLLVLANKYFKKYGINIVDIHLNQKGQTSAIFNEIEKNETPNNFNQPQSLPEHQPQLLDSLEKNEKYCPNCQSKIHLGSDYCSSCGYKLTQLLTFKNSDEK